MKEVKSFADWQTILKKEKAPYLFFYKKNGSPVNRCAMDNLSEATAKNPDIPVYFVNADETRDIHPNYPINSVPILLEFKDGSLKNTLKGCHEPSFFTNLFEKRMAAIKAEKEGKPLHSVTVYSTPTCSWCNTLKSYLRKNNIQFSDIDVSRDMEAAKEMVARSGQQGVPQSVIDGEVIVGFNKSRIDQLLGTR
jgi:glutaredoxin-like YruB-family protein